MKIGIVLLVACLATGLHGESESGKPIFVSSTVSGPIGYRIVKIDGREVCLINDSFTIIPFSIEKKSMTVEIELIRKSPRGDASDLRSFRADVKQDMNYQIIADGDIFTLRGGQK